MYVGRAVRFSWGDPFRVAESEGAIVRSGDSWQKISGNLATDFGFVIDAPLPAAVASGAEPFLIVGALSGG